MGKKLKLLFVITEDWVFVSHRLQLAVAASKAGFDVSVATRVNKHRDIIENAGIRLIPFEVSRRVGNPVWEVWDLYRLYRRERPDIVHHVALKLVLYGSLAARLAAIPAQVNAVTGLGWLFVSSNRFLSWGRPMFSRVLAYLLNSPRCRVIVQNPDDKKLLKQAGVPESYLRLILGSGVDDDKFYPVQKVPGPICVILATRILWDKGVGEFVEAARSLKKILRDARFVLVGKPDPDNPASVQEKIINDWQNEGAIEWWGHHEEMVPIFNSAHIVCLPSYREGLPKVLLEGASCGLPIVTTDVPGCREVVQNEANGILVPKCDSVALSNALQRLIANSELREQMGRRGREIVLEQFSSKIINSQTLDVYKEFT